MAAGRIKGITVEIGGDNQTGHFKRTDEEVSEVRA